MLFTSLVFLFGFLPTILVLYYLLPKASKNYLLLFFSLIFYAWGGVSYTLVLIISIIANYIFSRLIHQSTIHRKKWLLLGLLVNVGTLVFFKYLDFFIGNINALALLANHTFEPLPLAGIVLPLGISFFTFQEMSMLWDIYRNPQTKPGHFINTALYVSFFPQLIAGPIVRYNDIVDQINNRIESIGLVNSGIKKFILGLFKKIVFANTCGSLADTILNSELSELSTSVAWLGILAYALQIYFDFSGYSDMAIGLGRMFGFRILENFNFPYISTSIKEFWRRWHISLSSWFRDYLYIPLGGNRHGPYRTYFNLFVVFLLTGFWHGATWSFVFWGVFHGSFLIIERLGFDKVLNRLPAVISWMYTILVVLIGWVFFRIENFSDATFFVYKLFGGGPTVEEHFLKYLDNERLFILSLAIVASSTFFLRLKNVALNIRAKVVSIPLLLMVDYLLIGMMLYAVLYVNSGSYNPFIYFRF